MRVGLVVPGGVDPSGRERVIPAILWLVERLARRHEVDVLVLYHSPRKNEYDLLGARVHDLGLLRPRGLPGLGFLRAVGEVTRAVGELPGLDVIHAFWAGTPGYAAGVAARKARVPMLLSLGGGELVALRDIGFGAGVSARARWVVRRSLRLAAAVTAASGPMCRLAEARGVPAVRVPLGVDAGLFDLPPAADGPPWRLLQVADLNPVKDQPTLLRAFAIARRALPEVRLDVVGVDTMGGAVQRLAAELGVGDGVTFHGFLPTDAILPLLSRAHLLVHSSRHEAGPVVVLEAAAAGVPTVGTAVGHVVDLAPEGAVAVPAGDAEALADAIVRTLGEPGRRAGLAARARAFARENDADATARRFSELYEELAAR